MDFVKYVNKYTGQTRLLRIKFLAETFPEFRPQGVKMLLDELKRTNNWFMYGACCENFGVQIDKQWYETHKQQTKLHITQAEAKINTTRRARGDIQALVYEKGNLFYAAGQAQNAISIYQQALNPTGKRDEECRRQTQLSQIIACCNIQAPQRLENNIIGVLNALPSKLIRAKLNLGRAMSCLFTKDYKDAATRFLLIDPDLGSAFSEVALAGDIGLYAAMCLLATCSRDNLKRALYENDKFKLFLQQAPPQMKAALQDFYDCKYGSCMRNLAALQPTFNADIYLVNHAAELVKQIRTKAMSEYFSPYLSVKLKKMAADFGADSVEALENEVAQLIMTGKLKARIDSLSKVLHARHADTRHETYEKVLVMGQKFAREVQSLMLRASLHKNKIYVNSPLRTGRDRMLDSHA